MSRALEGKVALVTGAAKGIGKAIAKSLAAQGAYVYVNYNGSQAKAEETVEEIKAEGGNANCIKFNVADWEDTKQAADGILKEQGKLDILVNNAGITRDGLLMGMKEEDFDAVIDTNLKGAFHTIKAFSRNFLKQKSGSIINISSVSGILGNPGQANYSSSKAGLIGLTKSAAREFASKGIAVNAVAPGFIATDMVEKMTDDAKSKITDVIPLKRIGATEDVANLVTFLANPASSYITGQVIAVDGGMSI